MIKNYNELRQRVNLFNHSFESQSAEKIVLAHIQKIYSTHHYLAFSIRFPGKSQTLYLGRGSGHEGIHVRNALPPSPLRIRDRFLEYVRKYLVGSYLHPMIMASGDRVIHLPYSRAGAKSYLSLFYRGRALYYAHAEKVEDGKMRFFASWAKLQSKELELSGEAETLEYLEGLFSQVGAHYDLINEECQLQAQINLDGISPYFESLKKGTRPLQTRRKKFLQRKIANIEADLKRTKSWSELKLWVESPSFRFSSDYRQVICGHKFIFTSDLNHFQRMGQVYDKIKALKRGEAILEGRLQEARGELIQGLAAKVEEEYQLPDKVASPQWSSEEIIVSNLTRKDEGGFVEYLWRGVKWAVGTSSTGNDYLRSKWSNGSDLWFHLEGHPSAHLIVKREDLRDIREDLLGILASIIRDYSKLTIDPIPLIYTQVKNLKGIKGQAGSVTHKKTRHLMVDYNPKWKEIISSD